jgi:hypothetical protein
MSARAQLKFEASNAATSEATLPIRQKIEPPSRLVVLESDKPENMPWPKLRHFFTHCTADERQTTALMLLKNPKGAHALADLHRAELIDVSRFLPGPIGVLTALQWYCQATPIAENLKAALNDFPSSMALYSHHLGIVRSLLSVGLDINAQGHPEPSPLEMALLSGASPALVSALLACGANPVELCRDPLRNLSVNQGAALLLAPEIKPANNCLALAGRVAPGEVEGMLTESAFDRLNAGGHEKNAVLDALVQVAFSENRLDLFNRAFLSLSGFKYNALIRRCCLMNAGLITPEVLSELMTMNRYLHSENSLMPRFSFWQKRSFFSLINDLADVCLYRASSQTLHPLMLARFKGVALNLRSCTFSAAGAATPTENTLAASRVFSRVVCESMKRQQFDRLTLLLAPASNTLAAIPLSLVELSFKTVRQWLTLMAQTSEVQAKTVLLMLREKAVLSQGVFDERGSYQTPGWFNERLQQISSALVKSTVTGVARPSAFSGIWRAWRHLNHRA